MKHLVGLLFIGLVLFSCSEDTSEMEINSRSAQHLVEDYNQILESRVGGQTSSINYAFYEEGSIELVHQIDEKGQLFLSSMFYPEEAINKEDLVNFDVRLKKKINVPDKIESALVIYLWNQLIIKDLESDFEIGFHVETRQTGISRIQVRQSVDGEMIRVRKGPSVSIDLKSGNGCSCSCDPCMGVPGCPSSASCSCGCPGGDACAQACLGDNNAVCKKDCSEQ